MKIQFPSERAMMKFVDSVQNLKRDGLVINVISPRLVEFTGEAVQKLPKLTRGAVRLEV